MRSSASTRSIGSRWSRPARSSRGPSPAAVLAALVATTLLAAPAAWPGAGQEPDPPGATRPQRDIRDVLRTLRHREPAAPDTGGEAGSRRRTVILTPFLNYNPATSVIFGAAVLTSIYHGDPRATFPSTVQAGASVSLENQIGVSAKIDVYSDRDRWLFQANPAWARYPQSTYDLGTDSPDSSQVGVDLDIPKLLLSVYRQVLPDLFVGVGFQYVAHTGIGASEGSGTRWDGSEYVEYSLEKGFDLEEQSSAGVSANLLFDRRDSPVNASRGWFANATLRASFRDFLGGTSSWQELYVDLRNYRSLDRDARHRLALWIYTDIVTGGAAPYFDLPATGAVPRGRAGRGYDGSRFRGERMAYAELEYRATLTRDGLLGVVGFLNTQTFSAGRGGDGLFESHALGAGTGLRILVDKRTKSNLCLDVGFGKGGSRGLWAGFQEAF